MIFTQILIALVAAALSAPYGTQALDTFLGESKRDLTIWVKFTGILGFMAVAAAAAWECSGLAIYWVTPSVAGLGL